MADQQGCSNAAAEHEDANAANGQEHATTLREPEQETHNDTCFDERLSEKEMADLEAVHSAYSSIAEAITDGISSERLAQAVRYASDALPFIMKYLNCKDEVVDRAAHTLSKLEDEGFSSADERLAVTLRESGIMHRAIRLNPDFFCHAVMPVLAYEKDTGNSVALIPEGTRGYVYADSMGRMHRANKKLLAKLDENAYAFHKPFPQEKMTFGDLMRFISSTLSATDVFVIVMASAIVVLLGLLTPLFQKMLLSTVVDTENVQLLLAIGVFAVCTVVSSALVNMVNALAKARVSAKLTASVQSATMMRILSLPSRFFRENSSGELSSRATQMTSLATSFLQLVLSTGLTACFSIVYVFQLFSFAPSLAVPAIVVITLQLLIALGTMSQQDAYNAKKLELDAKQSGASFDILSGIRKIRLAGAEKRFFARWGEHYARSLAVTYNPPFLVRYGAALSAAIVGIGTIVFYYFATENGVSVSNYYAFNSAYGMASGALLTLGNAAVQVASMRGVLKVVRPILDAEPEFDPAKQVPRNLDGSIKMSHVTFRYDPTMRQIIDDVSFEVHPGEYLAIVGKTGCGKSTLLRLMLGFETPQQGAVYFGNQDVSTIDMRFLRRRLGLVMQDGKLFRGDIFSNIAISAPDITEDDAWRALEMVELADDVRNMPMQLHTMVGEGVASLSGGQKQRLLIARAIAGEPKILLFDEATSALDNVTQARISETLESLKCTRIVVAHRLSTITLCDRILVLDGGKIVQDGSYEELMEEEGLFRDLAIRQLS